MECDTGSTLPGPYLNTQASGYSFPSHLPLLDAVQTDTNILGDPKGLTYVPLTFEVCDGADRVRLLFPDQEIWSCRPLHGCNDAKDPSEDRLALALPPPSIADIAGIAHPEHRPVKVLETALFLTITSNLPQAGESNNAQPAGNGVPTNSMALSPHEQVVEGKPTSSTTKLRQPDEYTGLQPPIFHPGIIFPESSRATNERQNPSTSDVPASYTSAKDPVVTSSAILPPPNLPPTLSPESTNSPLKTNARAIILNNPITHGIPISMPPQLQPLSPTVQVVDASQPRVPAPPILAAVSTQTPLPPVATGSPLSPTAQVVDASQPHVPAPPIPAAVSTPTPLPPVATGSPLSPISAQSGTVEAMDHSLGNTQTLIPEIQITVPEPRYSFPTDATPLIVGDSTLSSQPIIAKQTAALTIGQSVITANSYGQYTLDGQTLTPGGAITVLGTRISLVAGETAVATDSSIQPPLATPPGGITTSSQSISAISGESPTRYVSDGHTLAPGDTFTTVSGAGIALATNGVDVGVGTSKETRAGSVPGGSGAGGSGAGGSGEGANTTKLQVFPGAAERLRTALHGGVTVPLMGIAALMCL